MKNADLKQVVISVVQNGYVVDERNAYADRCTGAVASPYVFNTFEELTDWLAGRLELPNEGPDAPVGPEVGS